MTALLTLLIVAMLPMWAIGMLTFIQWVRPAQGIDKSNIINRIRLWWCAYKTVTVRRAVSLVAA